MINDKNKVKLREHSKQHGGMGSRHMKDMSKFMNSGDSFSVAHKKAMKSVVKKKAPNPKRSAPKRKMASSNY